MTRAAPNPTPPASGRLTRRFPRCAEGNGVTLTDLSGLTGLARLRSGLGAPPLGRGAVRRALKPGRPSNDLRGPRTLDRLGRIQPRLRPTPRHHCATRALRRPSRRLDGLKRAAGAPSGRERPPLRMVRRPGRRRGARNASSPGAPRGRGLPGRDLPLVHVAGRRLPGALALERGGAPGLEVVDPESRLPRTPAGTVKLAPTRLASRGLVP